MNEPAPVPANAVSERESLLLEAIHLITGSRNASYGPPTQDFARTAEFWTTRFRHKLAPGERFEAHDVASAMILLKESRTVWSPESRDTWADKAGYAGCGWEAVCVERAAEGDTEQQAGMR